MRTAASEQIAACFDPADQSVDFGPCLVRERRAGHFDYAACRDRADRAALDHRQASGQSDEKTCRVKIAGSGRIDPLGLGHDAHMVDLAAVLDISALRADLNDGERTLAGNLVERLERIPLAGERECLLLI